MCLSDLSDVWEAGVPELGTREFVGMGVGQENNVSAPILPTYQSSLGESNLSPDTDLGHVLETWPFLGF